MSAQHVCPRDRGAAAVEFALVVPLLLAVLMGIIDYGLWFNDSLNLRQGVREGARQAVVENFGDAVCTTGGELDKAACVTEERIGATGRTWVKIAAKKADGTAGWGKGGQLLVCGIVKADGVTGFTPLPKNGLIRSYVYMRIETASPPVGQSSATRGGNLPAGASWSGVCA